MRCNTVLSLLPCNVFTWVNKRVKAMAASGRRLVCFNETAFPLGYNKKYLDPTDIVFILSQQKYLFERKNICLIKNIHLGYVLHQYFQYTYNNKVALFDKCILFPPESVLIVMPI